MKVRVVGRILLGVRCFAWVTVRVVAVRSAQRMLYSGMVSVGLSIGCQSGCVLSGKVSGGEHVRKRVVDGGGGRGSMLVLEKGEKPHPSTP